MFVNEMTTHRFPNTLLWRKIYWPSEIEGFTQASFLYHIRIDVFVNGVRLSAHYVIRSLVNSAPQVVITLTRSRTDESESSESATDSLANRSRSI
jgi:hypothetical protein